MVINVSEDIQKMSAKLKKDLAIVMSWCIGPHQEKVALRELAWKGKG